jgi:hypothetical protein
VTAGAGSGWDEKKKMAAMQASGGSQSLARTASGWVITVGYRERGRNAGDEDRVR